MFGFFKKKQQVFDGLTIKLDGPICSCDTQGLLWGLDMDYEFKTFLKIICKYCDTEVRIPYKSIKASINLKNKYPNDHKLPEFDNVIPFKK